MKQMNLTTPKEEAADSVQQVLYKADFHANIKKTVCFLNILSEIMFFCEYIENFFQEWYTYYEKSGFNAVYKTDHVLMITEREATWIYTMA